MNAKRKPSPCRLGLHNYIRHHGRYECVCGAVRECAEGEHEVVGVRRVNIPDSEYTMCKRCGKFGVSEFELTDQQRNRILEASALRTQAEKLIQRARGIEAEECTQVSAFWCPICGDCTCPEPEDALDDPDCPLHSVSSPHGESS